MSKELQKELMEGNQLPLPHVNHFPKNLPTKIL
jgi:hypothetical protein